jgi:glutathione S-transferase
MVIYHIACPADWEKAKADGEYRISTKGRTLDEQGFIHAGDVPQVAAVANLIYKEDDHLLVLVIETAKLSSEVKYDAVPGWDAPFPHVYGPINPDAVTDVLPLERDTEGVFGFEV